MQVVWLGFELWGVVYSGFGFRFEVLIVSLVVGFYLAACLWCFALCWFTCSVYGGLLRFAASCGLWYSF